MPYDIRKITNAHLRDTQAVLFAIANSDAELDSDTRTVLERAIDAVYAMRVARLAPATPTPANV